MSIWVVRKYTTIYSAKEKGNFGMLESQHLELTLYGKVPSLETILCSKLGPVKA